MLTVGSGVRTETQVCEVTEPQCRHYFINLFVNKATELNNNDHFFKVVRRRVPLPAKNGPSNSDHPCHKNATCLETPRARPVARNYQRRWK